MHGWITTSPGNYMQVLPASFIVVLMSLQHMVCFVVLMSLQHRCWSGSRKCSTCASASLALTGENGPVCYKCHSKDWCVSKVLSEVFWTFNYKYWSSILPPGLIAFCWGRFCVTSGGPAEDLFNPIYEECFDRILKLHRLPPPPPPCSCVYFWSFAFCSPTVSHSQLLYFQTKERVMRS